MIEESTREHEHASEQEFFDEPNFWEDEELVVERPLSLQSNAYKFSMNNSRGLEVHDRDLSTTLSQDDVELLTDNPHFSVKAFGSANSESSADGNIRPLTCKCSGSCLPDQESGADDSSQLYERLPSEDAFRIVEVLPGLYDDPIVCRLHVALISEAMLSYTALSYTWKLDFETPYIRALEQSLPKVSISCNSFEVPIGRNLFQAIKRIRQPLASVMLWADALCINQNDVQERTQQVRKMASIFKNAFQLVIWLGENNNNSYDGDAPSMAFPGLCRIVNRWREREDHSGRIPIATYSSVFPDQTCDTFDEPLAADDEIWSDILHFYNRRWFRRLWVLQEVALARSAVAIWGASKISWEWIGLAAAIIRTNYPRLTGLRENSQKVGYMAYSMSLNPRAVPTGIINAYFMYRISRSQAYFKAPHFTFHQLLTLTRQFRCEDPRDQIYGILGIPTIDQPLAQETPFIIPDYTKSVAEVYQEVAAKILDSSGSLELLSSVQRDAGSPEHYDTKLPTWVPQWRFVITQTLAPLEPSANFNPAGGRCMQRKRDSDASVLVIRGIEVDTVSAVTRDRRSFHVSYESFEHNLVDEHGLNEFRTSHYTQSDLEDLALTLTAGKNWHGLPVPNTLDHLADFAKCLLEDSLRWSLQDSAFGVKVKELGNTVSPSTTEASTPKSSGSSFVTEEILRQFAQNGRADRFLDTAATAGGRRTFFTSASGLRGIGPETMNCGDRVCILYGANVPFVLRPQVRGDGYILIGECYIHKLMHGEAVQRLSEPDSKLRETWIKLV
ncbi:heterokaryon incompatibility protein-domain-containing protein [Xylaria sp. FL1042]|nr:heterokaryon incompatibility protein-domain-containing protein [Xylaria sp. FL1042]